MSTIHVRVDRAICSNGERIEPGTTLKLPPLAAGDALRSGRCSLVYPDDAVAVQQAERELLRQQLRRGAEAPPDGWPWRAA